MHVSIHLGKEWKERKFWKDVYLNVHGYSGVGVEVRWWEFFFPCYKDVKFVIIHILLENTQRSSQGIQMWGLTAPQHSGRGRRASTGVLIGTPQYVPVEVKHTYWGSTWTHDLLSFLPKLCSSWKAFASRLLFLVGRSSIVFNRYSRVWLRWRRSGAKSHQRGITTACLPTPQCCENQTSLWMKNNFQN